MTLTLLFVFFALPLTTILLSIVLQKILKSPILVAFTVFSIFLIVSFVAFLDILAEALIATIIYTIIAYITASAVRIICDILKRNKKCEQNNNSNSEFEQKNDCGCNSSDETNNSNNYNENQITVNQNYNNTSNIYRTRRRCRR